MNKAIMLSIQPEWCELIASGKKTIEVRKTAPKLETPFKCYIYCTGGVGKAIIKDIMYRWNGPRLIKRNVDKGWLKDNTEQTWQILLDYGHTHQIHNGDYELNGKVIGEFVCDNVMRFTKHSGWLSDIQNYDISLKHLQETMLSCEELWKYGNGKPLYGWRISDLKIYDKPKELGDFTVLKKCVSCKYSGYESSACAYDEDCIIPMPLKRPFQSWGYVEAIQSYEVQS